MRKVKAELVQLLRPADDELHVGVKNIAAQEHRCVQAWTFYDLALAHGRALASYRAVGAATVDDIVLVGKNLAAYLVRKVAVCLGEVLRRQQAHLLQALDKADAATLGQKLAGYGMSMQMLRPLLVVFKRLFLVGNADIVVAGDDYRLELLCAEHCAQRAGAGVVIAACDRRNGSTVFARRADGEHAALDTAVALLIDRRLKLGICRGNGLSPKAARLVQREVLV